MADTCGKCGKTITSPAAWGSGGPEYRCYSCSLEDKRAYEAAVGKGGGCAVVAFLLLAAPLVTAAAGWMIIV